MTDDLKNVMIKMESCELIYRCLCLKHTHL
jgi:hypothetical protein